VLKRHGGTAAIVSAGGLGRRMGTAVPKQFLDLGGKPIFIRTLEKLDRCCEVDWIIVVVPSEFVVRAQKTIGEHQIQKVIQITPGGADRQDSIENSLPYLPQEAELVLVHDAVRPLVSVQKISESIGAARVYGAAIVAVPSRNTIKKVENNWVIRTVDRSVLWQVQTPQVFIKAWILEAYQKAREDGFRSTDDSMLVERLGHKVKVVLGEEQNIKITSREDLIFAEALVNKEHS
jgi:2-C-methyl-D-erythritol 4-phosphate cytidylyltransferase